jgi:NADH:ubiquinone oxidoreductase subunit E
LKLPIRRKKMEFIFDMEKNKDKIDNFKLFMQDYKETPGALMPVLQEAQGKFGYLPLEILQLISKILGIPMAEVYGVVTFYSQFSLIPKGENVIGICLGTACYVRGSQAILDEAQEILGIKAGGTTTDLKFSINATRCIGACGLAPVISVNDEVYGKLKKGDMKEIIKKYKTEV